MSEHTPDTSIPTPAETRQSKIDRRLVEMADGTEFTVRITNPDRLRWDLTAPRRGWPKGTDAPFLWLTFVTWAAAKRERLTELDWDAFQAQAVEVTQLDAEEGDVIRPTQTGATGALS